MSHYHCVVWIDHHEAHVIEFNPDDAEASIVHPKSKHEHLHHKRGVVGQARHRRVMRTIRQSRMRSRTLAKS